MSTHLLLLMGLCLIICGVGDHCCTVRDGKGIKDEHFCLTYCLAHDFLRDWDEKIIAQWGSIERSTATNSFYPDSIEHLTDHGVDDLVKLMYMSRIKTNDRDDMVQYADPAGIDKKDTPKPRLMSQLAGGFNLDGCKQVSEVRNDP